MAQQRAMFGAVALCCVAFFVMTVIAMLLYPGGSVAVPESESYSFFLNFFSDLGQTHVGSGASNAPSMLLFATALTVVACGLTLFFIAFSRLFAVSTAAVWMSRLAIACGLVTSISFVGVALTPWNLYLQAHNVFVHWAFRSLLGAIVLLLVSTFLEPGFARRFGVYFVVFAALLAAYVVLLALGPSAATPQGSIIQATGQKIIAYASILAILIESLVARAFLRGSSSTVSDLSLSS